MIDVIVGDIVSIVRLIYSVIDGLQANSSTRTLLLTRVESIEAIISTIPDSESPADSDSPLVSPLRDLSETLQKVLDTIKKQESRSSVEKVLKHPFEAADLDKLGSRISHCQQQLCTAIAVDNAKRKAKVRLSGQIGTTCPK
jgi:hypothetical protein